MTSRQVREKLLLAPIEDLELPKAVLVSLHEGAVVHTIGGLAMETAERLKWLTQNKRSCRPLRDEQIDSIRAALALYGLDLRRDGDVERRIDEL